MTKQQKKLIEGKKKPKIICIDWLDCSILVDDQLNRKSIEPEGLIHGYAVGILVKETDEFIIIARDWFDKQDDFRGTAIYPKSGIKSIKRY